MAQLKDLIVNGASQLIGDVTLNNKLIDKSGSAGINGQALFSNGSSTYWGDIPATVTSNTVAEWGYGKIISINTNNGLTGGGSGPTVTISHANKADGLTNLTAQDRTYVKSLTFDDYGHITEYTTGTETVVATVNTDRYVNAAEFIINTDTTTNVNYPLTLKLTRSGSDGVEITGNLPKISTTTAGIVPQGESYATLNQSTKFLSSDGSWKIPSYTAAQVQTDWNETSGIASIKNKPNLAPVALTGSYNNLSDTPTLFSGSYDDLTDKPTIPAAQQQVDWNATTGITSIANKPNLAPVATAGTYTSLSGTPSGITIAGIPLALDGGEITADTLRQSLGLSNAMHFKGTTSTVLTDNNTTNTININNKNYTAQSGDVVLYNGNEFVWAGSMWEQLGPDSSFKIVQGSISSPEVGEDTTIAFIDTITQNTNGEISATKKNLDTSGTWSGTANKAINDNDGKEISSSYLKLIAGTTIPASETAHANLNALTWQVTGSYTLPQNVNIPYVDNLPNNYISTVGNQAFTLNVYAPLSSNGTTTNGNWLYRIQEIVPYSNHIYRWRRTNSTNGSGVWSFGSWVRQVLDDTHQGIATLTIGTYTYNGGTNITIPIYDGTISPSSAQGVDF